MSGNFHQHDVNTNKRYKEICLFVFTLSQFTSRHQCANMSENIITEGEEDHYLEEFSTLSPSVGFYSYDE